MSTEFESLVLKSLSSIEDRLSCIEDRFDEATSFASNMLGEDGGILGTLDISSIRNVMESLASAQDNSTPIGDGSDKGQLYDLSSALKSFKDRLEELKEAIPPYVSGVSSGEIDE